MESKVVKLLSSFIRVPGSMPAEAINVIQEYFCGDDCDNDTYIELGTSHIPPAEADISPKAETIPAFDQIRCR